MRQSLAKATRRSLRRAIGPDAIQTIAQQDQAVATLAASLHSVRQELLALEKDHAILKQQVERVERLHGVVLDGLEKGVQALEAAHHAGFRARVRHLLTGK